jgi:hypothetical protein
MTPTLLYIQAKHAFEQLREEIRNRNLEEINMLRISLDAQIEELEQHFETAHLNYLQQTAQRTHDFKELTQNDQRLSRDIELKKKKIDGLQVLPPPPPLYVSPVPSFLSMSCPVMSCLRPPSSSGGPRFDNSIARRRSETGYCWTKSTPFRSTTSN